MRDACLTCPQCNQPMRLVRSIPAIGLAWPALLVFFCAACNQAETREEESLIASTAVRADGQGQIAASR